MFNFIFQIRDIYLFLFLSSIFILFSVVSILLIKRFIPLDVRYKNNPVIGNISSLIGVIYGVFVGLTALYLFNNNSYTADAVQREANAAANIYRDSNWLKEPTESIVQTEVKTYIANVINVEWPDMQNNKVLNDKGDITIDKIANAIKQYNPITHTEALILHDMLDEIKALYDAREQRIHMSNSELAPEIWVVIIIGTLLTLGINFLFGINTFMHMISISALGFMVSSMIFLLVSLDRPFQGEFVIEPDAFRSVLLSIEKHHPVANNINLMEQNSHEKNIISNHH